MSYSDKIYFLRKSANLTQEELAKLLNIKRHTICDWETGRTEPNIKNLMIIANFFNVSINYLLDIENVYCNSLLDFESQKEFISFIPEKEVTINLMNEIKSCNEEQQNLINLIITKTVIFK